MKSLTEKQKEVLEFIQKYQKEEQVPPSTRVIQHHFGYQSPNTAAQHLKALASKGKLEQFSDGKWGVKTLTTQTHLFEVPVYGSIPAGLPAMQEQDPENVVSIDPSIFGIRNPKQGHFWFLRVTGDSMIGARIFDGDLVALARRDPRPGEIIAALVDETTTTLKTYIREGGRTLLRAANKRFSDILPKQLESQGVVVGVIRRILP